MPVPIPGSKVRSDNQNKFFTSFGRPKTGIFRRFRGVPGRAPLATNHAVDKPQDCRRIAQEGRIDLKPDTWVTASARAAAVRHRHR